MGAGGRPRGPQASVLRILCCLDLKGYLPLCLCSQEPLGVASSLILSISPPGEPALALFTYRFYRLFTCSLISGLPRAFVAAWRQSLVAWSGGCSPVAVGGLLIAEHGGLRGPWARGLFLGRGRSGACALAAGFSPTGHRGAQLGFRRCFLASPLQDCGFFVFDPSSLCSGFALRWFKH